MLARGGASNKFGSLEEEEQGYHAQCSLCLEMQFSVCSPGRWQEWQEWQKMRSQVVGVQWRSNFLSLRPESGDAIDKSRAL